MSGMFELRTHIHHTAVSRHYRDSHSEKLVAVWKPIEYADLMHCISPICTNPIAISFWYGCGVVDVEILVLYVNLVFSCLK